MWRKKVKGNENMVICNLSSLRLPVPTDQIQSQHENNRIPPSTHDRWRTRKRLSYPRISAMDDASKAEKYRRVDKPPAPLQPTCICLRHLLPHSRISKPRNQKASPNPQRLIRYRLPFTEGLHASLQRQSKLPTRLLTDLQGPTYQPSRRWSE